MQLENYDTVLMKQCGSEAPDTKTEFWARETAESKWFTNILEVWGGLIHDSVVTTEVKSTRTC